VALGRSAAILKIAVDAPCRVRLYPTPEQRVLDLERDEVTSAEDPIGLIADVVFATDGYLILSPIAVGSDMRDDPTGSLSCTVTNKAGYQRSIAVTFTYLTLET
jgi:hypothetical protein